MQAIFKYLYIIFYIIYNVKQNKYIYNKTAKSNYLWSVDVAMSVRVDSCNVYVYCYT